MNLHAKFGVSTSNVPEISRESKNFKSRSHDPFLVPFDLILHLPLIPQTMNRHAKFDISTSNRSRDMEGVPKFQN